MVLLLASKMKKDTQIMNKLVQRSQATNGNDTRSGCRNESYYVIVSGIPSGTVTN